MADDVVSPESIPFDFRRTIDLRLDADGQWFHDGEPFTHRGLIALFNRGIDVSDETGEPIVRIGAHWAYIRCDDVPFVIRSVRVSEAALDALLNTESRVTFPPDALRLGPAGVLYAELSPRRRARFSRAAQASLALHLVELDTGGFAFRSGAIDVRLTALGP
ncbi:DUF1285 domain-containing protein [Myxococcota bacterium]|jgi:hypothetical protein|nr:DUF1285 domain-containing protein [Myxococcota bacterium]